MKKLLLLLTALFLLAACNGKEDDPSEQPTAAVTPIFYLQSNALPIEAGVWSLNPESVNYEERQAALILNGQYRHVTSTGIASLSLNVYRNAPEAQQTFNDRLAEWQSNPANVVERITAFGDDAYTLNSNQAGIALVNGDGLLLLTIEGEAANTDLELLHLMQFGVEILGQRNQPPPPQENVASATLAIPPTETPQP